MQKTIALFFLCLVVVINTAQAQKVNEKDVPSNIRAIAREQSNGNAVNLWVLDKGRNKYVASVMNQSVLRVIEISLSGSWIATTDALQEASVPAVIMKTVREKYLNKGFEALNYTFVRSNKEGSFYAVELSSDDNDLYITLNEKGHVLREDAQ